MKERVTTGDAPTPAGRYSQAVRFGDMVFVSGQVPRSADGSYEPASVADETRRTVQNLQAVLAAAGVGLDDVVKVTVYLTDIDDFAEFDAAYAPFFPGDVPPARTTVVAGLRQVKVEIDAIAIHRH